MKLYISMYYNCYNNYFIILIMRGYDYKIYT